MGSSAVITQPAIGPHRGSDDRLQRVPISVAGVAARRVGGGQPSREVGKRESLILSWVTRDKHNFTQNPYDPHWQIPLGVRESDNQKEVNITKVAPP